MGVQKQTVQSLIFQCFSSDALGIRVVPSSEKPVCELLITDNTLNLLTACGVPFEDGMSAHSESEVVAHIVRHSVNAYKALARTAAVLLLFDDGSKGFKPAVREARDLAPTNECQRHYRAHRTETVDLVLTRLSELGVAYGQMYGRSSDGAPGRVHPEGCPRARELLSAFARGSEETEGDTLMFEFLMHLRADEPHVPVHMVSKDTDMVGNALALLAERGECLGNTVFGLSNPMFTARRTKHRKTREINRDFDVALAAHNWNRDVHLRSRGDGESRPDWAGPPTPATWDLLLDCEGSGDVSVLGALVAALQELLLVCHVTHDRYMESLRHLHTKGVRGPGFRRVLVALSASEAPSLQKAALSWFLGCPGTSTKATHAEFRSLMELAVRCEASDPLCATSKSHVQAMVRCVGLYAEGAFAKNTYGRYLTAISASPTVYLRLSATAYTRQCAALCAFSGTDYSLPLDKLGGVQITQLFTDPAFGRACRGLGDPDRWREGAPALINATKVRLTANHDAEEVRSYCECLWRSAHYVLDLWHLKRPVPSERYGYANGGFAHPRERGTGRFFTLSAKGRAVPLGLPSRGPPPADQ